MSAPLLHEVLANVQPGRHVRLYLTAEQKTATADRDGLILRRVIRALLAARHGASDPPPRRFPLTEHTFAAVARQIGCPVGIKRARTLIRRGIACGLLAPSSSYTSRTKRGGDGGGHRVRLYRLGCRITGLRRARLHTANGTPQAVKSCDAPSTLDWWLHPLFGSADGLPPPQARGKSRRAKRLRRWREAAACR